MHAIIRKYPALALIAAACAALTGASASASADPLRACYDDWAPYLSPARSPLYDSVTAAAMEGATGVVAMLTRAAALRFGETVAFFRRSHAACLDGVGRGKFDLMLVDSDGRGVGVAVETPVAYWVLSAVVPASSPLERFDTMEDFRDLRFLAATGYRYPDIIDGFDGWRATETRDAALGPRIIARERADVFIDDLAWLRGVVEDEQLTGQVKILEPPIAVAPQYIVVTARRPSLAAQFEAALSLMDLRGEIDRAYAVALNWTPTDIVAIAPPGRPAAAARKALAE